MLAAGGDFLMTAKPDSHVALYAFMNGAEFEEMAVTRKEGNKKLTFRYRWFSGAPLREGRDALNVNWIGLSIADARGKLTYSGAFRRRCNLRTLPLSPVGARTALRRGGISG